jgi:ATP-dependent helicase/nuclease subunit B
VGTIPATIDCVNIGSIASQRNCDTPYLFIIGANEGAFPGIQTNLSLLSDRERQQLIDLEIGISPNTITSGLLYRELAMIDSVLGGHAQTLYLSAIDGKQSYFYLRGEKLFPNAMHIERDEALTLRSKRDYEAKYSYVDPYKIPDLSPKAVDKLYGKVLSLSASKLETGASCRFGYFLQYGLRAKESLIAEVDASIYGTFVHDILENTCKQVKKEGGFHRVSLERVLEIADGYMERFAMEELSELWHSDRAEYLFRRNFREVRSVVKQLYEELSVSLFEPEYFELNFSDREGADIGAISIQGQEVRGKLEGKVDRVDLWKSMGRTYYRVVDYKTGRTSFDYTKVYYGLGLQMLLYLFALKKYGHDLEHENLTPAGVLYFPARKGKISVKNRNDVDALRKEREKQERRSGILLSNESVLQAMEPGDTYRFLPCKKKKDGELAGDLASTEDLQLLEKHVFRQISGIADGIHSGKLEPNPYYMDSNYFGCAWCPFTSVCKGQGEKRVFEKVNAEEFWERLREEEQNG